MVHHFPLVSICIPAYNDPILFKRCLDSILSQTYPHIEIIISDDSTNKDVKELLSKVSTDYIIKYFSNVPALKSPSNWNNAIDHASGDLILLMHHDDFFSHHNSVKAFVDLFEKDQAIDIVFSTPQTIDEAGKILQLGYSSKAFTKVMQHPHLLFVSNILGAPSNMMLRKNKLRYREDLVWLVDMEYYYRQILSGLSFSFTPESLVTTGVHQNQTTAFCNAHPDIALREHILVGNTLSNKDFADVVLYDHLWRQLRNNKIRSINDPLLLGYTMPESMKHMLQYLTKLPVSLSFNGFLSKAMMFLSYIFWLLRSK
jgi:glycosyltransferase involved in cell wall biosynthesis